MSDKCDDDLQWSLSIQRAVRDGQLKRGGHEPTRSVFYILYKNEGKTLYFDPTAKSFSTHICDTCFIETRKRAEQLLSVIRKNPRVYIENIVD